MRRSANTLAYLTGGDLFESANISQPTTPTDGETKPTWSNLDTAVPVQRLYRGGFANAQRQGVEEFADTLVRMHFRTDVKSKMRIRIRTASTGTDDVLEIISVGDPVGNRRWLECKCVQMEST